MTASDFLGQVAGILNRLQVPYLVTGSMASTAYGESRLTHDVDIVIDLFMKDAARFLAAFPEPDFYCSKDALELAVKERFTFNVIHNFSAMKIDFFVTGRTEYETNRFLRNVVVKRRDGVEISFAAPEDVIIKKMDYFREGESQKHVTDILGMLKLASDRINMRYIDKWAAHFGLTSIWEGILDTKAGIDREETTGLGAAEGQ